LICHVRVCGERLENKLPEVTSLANLFLKTNCGIKVGLVNQEMVQTWLDLISNEDGSRRNYGGKYVASRSPDLNKSSEIVRIGDNFANTAFRSNVMSTVEEAHIHAARKQRNGKCRLKAACVNRLPYKELNLRLVGQHGEAVQYFVRHK
uniref:SCP domain-containing protein n=1 Tax=Thelazia callipaeda TaxID=103827 RepID=A0A0N5D0C2_THECL